MMNKTAFPEDVNEPTKTASSSQVVDEFEIMFRLMEKNFDMKVLGELFAKYFRKITKGVKFIILEGAETSSFVIF